MAKAAQKPKKNMTTKAAQKTAPKKSSVKASAKPASRTKSKKVKDSRKVAAFKGAASQKTSPVRAAPAGKKPLASKKKNMTPKAAAKVKAHAKSGAAVGDQMAFPMASKIPRVALKPNVQPAKKAASDSGSGHAPKIGDAISDFALPSTDGEFRLSTHKGQKVVLYFYPKDATPGCTLEGHDFSKLKNDFAAAGAVVLGVSRDDMKSHEKFKAKEGYTVDLISDADETLCQMFDVIKMKNMYGKSVLGIERSTFVIDENGKLAEEWRKVSVPGHAAEVLAKVKAL